MNLPSVKKMVDRGYTLEQATAMRGAMERYRRKSMYKFPRHTLNRISEIIGGEGVEEIANPLGDKRFWYINMGDSYAETVCWIHGRFVLCSWGAIVERGGWGV